MGENEFILDENGLKHLDNTIKGRKYIFLLCLAVTLGTLIGFAFETYKVGDSDRWLIMLIYFLIPVCCIIITIIVFRVSKRFLIEGMMIKCMHPELEERTIKPLSIFNLIYGCEELILGFIPPAILVLVVFEVKNLLIGLWAIVGMFTILATMEFQIFKTLEKMRFNSISRE